MYKKPRWQSDLDDLKSSEDTCSLWGSSKDFMKEDTSNRNPFEILGFSIHWFRRHTVEHIKILYVSTFPEWSFFTERVKNEQVVTKYNENLRCHAKIRLLGYSSLACKVEYQVGIL